MIEAISELLGENKLPVMAGEVGADISPWMKDGVPMLSLQTDHTKYFYYHHSEGKSTYLMFCE